MNDLDTRAAALATLVRDLTRPGVEPDALEYALRAALQKPALHEPVTEAEVQTACDAYSVTRLVYVESMRRALESVLQGRAQPAQAEPQPVAAPTEPSPAEDGVLRRAALNAGKIIDKGRMQAAPKAEQAKGAPGAADAIEKLPRFRYDPEREGLVLDQRGPVLLYVDVIEALAARDAQGKAE